MWKRSSGLNTFRRHYISCTTVTRAKWHYSLFRECCDDSDKYQSPVESDCLTISSSQTLLHAHTAHKQAHWEAPGQSQCWAPRAVLLPGKGTNCKKRHMGSNQPQCGCSQLAQRSKCKRCHCSPWFKSRLHHIRLWLSHRAVNNWPSVIWDRLSL